MSKKTNIKYRQTREQDLDNLVTMMIGFAHETHGIQHTRPEMYAALSQYATNFFVAVRAGKIIGTMSWNIFPRTIKYGGDVLYTLQGILIGDGFVKQAYRGTGIGEELLRRVEGHRRRGEFILNF